LSISKEKKLTPQAKYDKANTKIYALKVVRTTEEDIMKKLDEQGNKSGYIKSLIRQDILKNI